MMFGEWITSKVNCENNFEKKVRKFFRKNDKS
jgi:hypothetical protein